MPKKPLPLTQTDNPSEAWQHFEEQRLSRRTALRKMGLTTGSTLFGMFAIDDLARMMVGKVKEHQASGAIAEVLSAEFKNAGMAFAGSPSQPSPCAGSGCAACCTQFHQWLDACEASANACYDAGKPYQSCTAANQLCNNCAVSQSEACLNKNSCTGCTC